MSGCVVAWLPFSIWSNNKMVMNVTDISGGYATPTAAQTKQRTRTVLYMILGSWILVLVARLIPIGGEWLPIDSTTRNAIVIWPTLFAFSYLLTAGPLGSRRARIEMVSDIEMKSWMALATSFVAATGALLIIFDLAILRGYGFATSAALIRDEEGNAAVRGLLVSSPVSGMGRLMMPAVFVAVILLASSFRDMSKKRIAAAFLGIIIVVYEQVSFEGGRTVMATIILCALTSYYLSSRFEQKEKKKKKRKYSIPVIVGSGAILFAMAYFTFYIYVSRVLARNDFFWSSYLGFTRIFTIHVSSSHLSRLEGFFGGIWYSVDMLWLYITQGINELDLVLTQPNLPHAYGTYQFPHFAAIASIVFDIDIRYDVATYLPNAGTYLTIYGANFVDFGHLGAILSAAILGVLTAWTANAAIRRSTSFAALWGPLFVTVGLFSPVISVLTTVWPAFFWAIGVSVILSRRPQQKMLAA